MSKAINTGTSITRKELASRLGVCVSTIKRWEKFGQLTPVRFGPRTVRYPADYVEKLERDGIPSTTAA